MSVELEWTTRAMYAERAGRSGVTLVCSVCQRSVDEYMTACGNDEYFDESVSVGICAECLESIGLTRKARI